MARVAGWASVLSLAAYVVFSQELRYIVRPFFYHLGLVKMYFSSPPPHDPTSLSPVGTAYALAFVASVLIAGLLAARLFGAPGERGVWVILAACAAAVVPTLFLAIVWWPDGRGRLTPRAILAANCVCDALLVLLLLRFRARARQSAASSTARTSLPRSTVALILAAGLVLGAALLSGSPTPEGYDSIAYHLPLAASWLKLNRLATGYDVQFFYPGNMELLLRWVLATGTDHAAHLVSWLSAVGCVYLLYRIAAEVGQPRHAAVVVGLAIVTSPTVIYLATTAYTDLFMVLWLLAAIFFLLRWEAVHEAHYAVAMGLALGLALGAKYSALPAAAVLTLGWCSMLVSIANRRRVFGQLVAFAFALALPCAYWYLRNLVLQRNPVYPVQVLGLPGLPMRSLIRMNVLWTQPDWRWLLYPWVSFGYDSLYESGLGALFAAVVIISFVLYPFSGATSRRTTLLYVTTIALFAAYLFTGSVAPRYLLFPTMLSFVFLGVAMTTIQSRALRTATLISFALMSAVLVQSLLGGYFFEKVRWQPGAMNVGLPAQIDQLAPATIFNAAGQFLTYHAMGRDYRHDVITLFRDATPSDVRRYRSEYVILRCDEVPEFRAALPLTLIAEGRSLGQQPLSLWRLAPENGQNVVNNKEQNLSTGATACPALRQP